MERADIFSYIFLASCYSPSPSCNATSVCPIDTCKIGRRTTSAVSTTNQFGLAPAHDCVQIRTV